MIVLRRRALAVGVGVVLAAGACKPERAERSGPTEAPRGDAGPPRHVAPKGPPPTPWVPAAIAHCGSGTPPEQGSGCAPAIDAALAILAKGGDPLDAATAGVVVLEDDPRYNAGTGSAVRLDGHTVEMDASVMDSTGRFGAVIGLQEVKNPIRVARAVLDTPHRILAGAGATAFARAIGEKPWDPRRPETLADAQQARTDLVAGDVPESWRGFDWRRVWNYDAPLPGASGGPEAGVHSPGGDTVGVAVRTADGKFGAALSTGGWVVVLRGRVGDVPIPGAGIYAGPYGAVVATGLGERIIDVSLARTVHGWLAEGVPAKVAAERGVDLLDGDAALIVITATETATAARDPMASCTRSLAAPP